MNKENILVTGGGGFIGSHLCRQLLSQGKNVTCYDKLDPRVVNPRTLAELSQSVNFKLINGDLLDLATLTTAMMYQDAVIHTAAISAVDYSIRNPIETIRTNVLGTLNVMEAARSKGVRRVHYLSTDEIFGHSISGSFNENSPGEPRNPYAAGKLGGESIVFAWGATFGMEITITNSANNYGPYQAPEKLIPRLCIKGLNGLPLPVYGDGRQVREWISVDDHVKAILHVLNHGVLGEKYCVGSGETHENLEIVNQIVDQLGLSPTQIQFVEDRKGHDIRYAVDTSKLKALGWQPEAEFIESLNETINWYKNHPVWWQYYLMVYPDLKPQEIIPLTLDRNAIYSSGRVV